jgi:hypothetical protein
MHMHAWPHPGFTHARNESCMCATVQGYYYASRCAHHRRLARFRLFRCVPSPLIFPTHHMQGAFGLVSPNVRINFPEFAVLTCQLQGNTTFKRTRRASTIFANFFRFSIIPFQWQPVTDHAKLNKALRPHYQCQCGKRLLATFVAS